MRRSVGAEPIAVRVEPWLPVFLDDLGNRLLDETVQDRGNTQWPVTALWLGDHGSPHRFRPVGLPDQLLADVWPVLAQMVRQLVDCHAVDTRRAFVTSNLFQGATEVVLTQYARHPRWGLNGVGTGPLSPGTGSSPGDSRGSGSCLSDAILLLCTDIPLLSLFGPSVPRLNLLYPLLIPDHRSTPVAQGSVLSLNNGQASQGKTQNCRCVNARFIKYTPVADGGLRGHVPARPGCTTPHIGFLFVVPQLWIGLPPDLTSR